ncbi:NlpC/P60 family protein [Anaerobacillus sp. MEB173]|uniref:C40 family peptidase n=1 Tax=Anaerobacillus sp. MEB173 TaxID=3383345 RepID=UPI003F9166A3
MKKQSVGNIRWLVIVFVSLGCILNGAGFAHAYRDVPTAGVFVNGKVVDGINPIIISDKMHLPFVQLAKMLGYNHITFEDKTLTYEVTDGSTKLRTTMGGTLARRGDEYIHIEPPRWINQTAYISLNASSALFNANIHFKSDNGSIQVTKPAQFYLVQKDDSLWEIASAHHITVQELKNTNNLGSNHIVVGQKLTIPISKPKEVTPIKEHQPVKVPDNTKSVNVIRQSVLDHASKYIGAGYKFGATLDEAPNLFDCSSYTQLVFKKNGIDIPRVSRDQARKGTYVTELKPGDLMFFTNNDLYSDGRVGHVGIYMGDGRMIHASSSLGVDITDNVLGNRYWSSNYLFSKRIIE